MDGSGQQAEAAGRAPTGTRDVAGADGAAPAAPSALAFREHDLMLHLARISDAETRRSILALARALASDGEGDAGIADPPGEAEILAAFRSIDDATTRDSVLRLIASLAASGV